jgi:hypothetical protein
LEAFAIVVFVSSLIYPEIVAMTTENPQPDAAKKRRYEVSIWSGHFDAGNPSKVVTVFSEARGVDLMRELERQFGSDVIISAYNEEDANAIRQAAQANTGK